MLARLSSSAKGTKVGDAESRGTSSSSDTPRSGGNLRSAESAVLPLKDLRSPQGPNRVQTDLGCLKTKRVPQDSNVQDVEPLIPEQAVASPSLDGKSRSKGCLLARPNQKQLTQVSGSDVLGKAFLFSGSSIRASHSAMAVLSPNRGSTGQAQEQGDQHLGLHRRPCSVEQKQGRASGPCPGNNLSLRKPGTNHQHEEVKSFAHLIADLGRGSLGRTKRHMVPKAKELRRNQVLSHSSPRHPGGIKETMGKALRNRCLRGPDKQKSQAFQSSDLTLEPLQPRPRQRQGGKVPSLPSKGIRPLDKGGLLANTRAVCLADSHNPMLDRRVQSRLGHSQRPRPIMEGPLVSKTKLSAHQCPGTSDYPVCDQANASAGPDPNSMVRQPDIDKCYPETRFPLPRPAEASRANPRDLRGEESPHLSSPHQGILECSGRRPLKRGGDTGGMGVERGDLSVSAETTREGPPSGSVRIPSQPQASGLLLPIPVSLSMGTRRPGPRLELVQSSSDLPASRSCQGGSLEASQLQGGDTSPPGQSCSPTPLPDPFPVQGTDLRAAAARTRRENHPGIRGVRSLSRLEFLKAVYLLDYEEEVVTDLLGHLAKSSLRQYQSAWKRFQDWLPEATEDISLPLVLKFLVYCNRNLSSSTVLTIRAALSLPLSEGFGIDFEHKHFSMLAKAAFRKKPPAQRVVPSWSLEDALRALARKRTKSNDKLSRFRKALFLVACASSNRASELAAIDRSRVEIRQHSALLPVRPGFLFKNQAQNHTPSLMDIPDLPGSALCPVKALKEYLADTKSSTEPGLFLHPSSGKTLNAGRLAHFLAKTIDWLIPEALGKAHDTRKLSTSRAFCAGISAQQIVAAGSWRSTNTFAKRYFVPALPKAKGSAVVARSRC